MTAPVSLGVAGNVLAILNAEGHLALLEPMPCTTEQGASLIDPGSLRVMLRPFAICDATVIMERRTGRPSDTAATAFAFGVQTGSAITALRSLGATIVVVTSLRWRSSLGVDSTGLATINAAAVRFPATKFYAARPHYAVAALLAEYGRLERQHRDKVVGAAIAYAARQGAATA